MFEVPRRSLTVGHTGCHHIHAETREQALNRIMRKLSDMGFTLGSHPNLRQKVTEQLIVFSCLTPHIPWSYFIYRTLLRPAACCRSVHVSPRIVCRIVHDCIRSAWKL
ncbi:hypothetical protein EDD15DRAFT_1888170 [Pisolithus albus]|nr:hypothetical protein EDD15DRAFT_1888170 [Pisolithus albus]